MHADNALTTEREHVLKSYLAMFNALSDSRFREQFRQLTTPEICFSDPFNTVSGQDAVLRVLEHFARTIRNPHFDILHIAWSGDTCLVRWDFSGQFPNGPEWRFPGVSELRFAPDNRIAQHTDHWDAATWFYQRLPLIGAVIRWIKHRISRH